MYNWYFFEDVSFSGMTGFSFSYFILKQIQISCLPKISYYSESIIGDELYGNLYTIGFVASINYKF
ncbi:MAG: hypothetical protein HY738_23455 [Bacteroidia bacterium]|nr:hypothetical protein [Bacteroidia bacterium]